MASKELFAQVEQIIWRDRARVIPSRSTDLANEMLNAILAALQDPTEASLEAGYAWDEHVSSTETHPRNRGLWRAMLNASPLGEKAE